MPLDDYNWRPITFQGVTFPATFMAADALESILNMEDEDFGSWLLHLTICCGVTKSEPAERCARCAQKAVDLMLENRQRLLDGIRELLGSYGFEPESTYRDWIAAFQQIVELSGAADGDCSWSAPSHEGDDPSLAGKLLKFLDKERARILGETESD